MSKEVQLANVRFEVHGKVQGVFFRKHTQHKAKELGLNGWCMNTEKGTVVGELEGVPGKIEEMKQWLKSKGSPKSKIEKAEFQGEKLIERFSFSDFNIRK